jgi:ribosome biogenesis protein Nip4
MKRTLPVFRKATKEEEILVKETFDYFLDKESTDPLDNYHLWTKEGKIKEIYAVPEETNRLLQNMNKTIYSSGTPLGSIFQNEFQLEIEGAYLIMPFTSKVIKTKTEQFLYGKPIFVENIESFKTNFEEGDLLIIEGRNKLHYGVGVSRISSKSISNAKSNSIIIKESEHKPRDRGWYLRHGK